jgi:glycerol uptake facilitator-like aquaporin/protein-tyrosine-phosphatase
MQPPYNVLFLCTGNSARSIMAEAIMNQKGRPNFVAYSAGSHPSGKVRPEALRELEAAQLPTSGLRSKSWEEFARREAPRLDFVFTVCDNTANEVCPIWPGQPVTAHWGVPDPAAVQGTPETNKTDISRGFPFAGPENQPVSVAASRHAQPHGVEKRNRQRWASRAGPAMNFPLRSRAAAEFLGTAFLLAAVVGSGIMGERLAAGNVAMALLSNALSTGAALAVLILVLAPVSGAHLNPAVTLAMSTTGNFPWREVPGYLLAQFAGAFAGVAAAHLMFGLPLFFASTHVRHGAGQLWSEAVATFGLVFVVWGCSRFRPSATAWAVGAYIMSAYWFTASTSFANPAVTLARSASDTFAGIRAGDVPGFVGAQLLGAGAATLCFRWLVPVRVPELSAKRRAALAGRARVPVPTQAFPPPAAFPHPHDEG